MINFTARAVLGGRRWPLLKTTSRPLSQSLTTLRTGNLQPTTCWLIRLWIKTTRFFLEISVQFARSSLTKKFCEMMLKIILFCNLFAIITSQFDLGTNEPCISTLTNAAGVCVEPKNCPEFRANRGKINICSFIQRFPIVCCPKTAVTTSVSFRPFETTSKPLDSRFEARISQKSKFVLWSHSSLDSNRSMILECNEYSSKIKKKVEVASLSFDSPSTVVDVTDCEAVTGLIVGGVRAEAGEFPHMAAIGYIDFNRELSFKCGGSLISESFVLTAAHCTYADRTRPSIVRLGDLDLTVRSFDSVELDIPIESFTSHELYNRETRQNDIALIKMRNPVTFTKFIRPACLHNAEPSGNVTAVGFGYTEYAGAFSNTLMKVGLNVLDNNVCVRAYDDNQVLINRNQVCAGVLAGGFDTCQGGKFEALTFTICSTKFFLRRFRWTDSDQFARQQMHRQHSRRHILWHRLRRKKRAFNLHAGLILPRLDWVKSLDMKNI